MATRPSYAEISQRESFRHEHLKLSENSIRLFQVQSGLKSDPLSLRITQFALHKRPPYKAISYTWGSAVSSHSILVNGRSFRIHENLWDLLCHLRARKETSFLWADRMCIDQDNLNERNFHVQLMGNIYDRSLSVVVWLGQPSADRTEIRAIELIRDFNSVGGTRKEGQMADIFLQDLWVHRWETLLRFCRHIYWTRTWIVQEFLRAPKLEVHVGMRDLQWEEFETMLDNLQQPAFASSDIIAKIIQSRPARLTLRRRAKESTTLRELLHEYHDSDCTDRRDKVYGILGLASDCIEDVDSLQVHGIRPEYQKHVVDVYIDAVQCIYQTLISQSLVGFAPSAAHLVYRSLLLKDIDVTDFLTQVRLAAFESAVPMMICPDHVGVVRNTFSWTSLRDLRLSLQQLQWGDLVGFEIKSPRASFGKRSSARAIPAELPDDMIQNTIDAAEADPELSLLYNYPHVEGLSVAPEHIAWHMEDKRVFENETFDKPLVVIEQRLEDNCIRTGFACTNVRRGDLILQFRGLDSALVVRQYGVHTHLVGKAVLINHRDVKSDFGLDTTCVPSPWFSPCPTIHNPDRLHLQTDALSLAELLVRQ